MDPTRTMTVNGDAKSVAVERRAQDASPRRERTRAKVLEAAFELIGHEQGLSIRIEEICAKARVSRGTFYNYFSSMDDLFAALSFELSDGFNQAMHATVQSMPTNAERSDAAMRYYLERARKDTIWGWAMVHICAHGSLFGSNTFAAARKSIEEGIAAGEFDVVDAQIGRDLVLGAAYAVMSSQLRHHHAAASDRAISSYVLRGLGVPSERIAAIVSRELPPIDLE